VEGERGEEGGRKCGEYDGGGRKRKGGEDEKGLGIRGEEGGRWHHLWREVKIIIGANI